MQVAVSAIMMNSCTDKFLQHLTFYDHLSFTTTYLPLNSQLLLHYQAPNNCFTLKQRHLQVAAFLGVVVIFHLG